MGNEKFHYLGYANIAETSSEAWSHSDDSRSGRHSSRRYELAPRKGVTLKANHPPMAETAMMVHNNGVSPCFLESEEFMTADDPRTADIMF